MVKLLHCNDRPPAGLNPSPQLVESLPVPERIVVNFPEQQYLRIGRQSLRWLLRPGAGAKR
jgi:hypothetical protein